jgi:hypothetical protein
MTTTDEERIAIENLRTLIPVLQNYEDLGLDAVFNTQTFIPSANTLLALLDRAYPPQQHYAYDYDADDDYDPNYCSICGGDCKDDEDAAYD